MNRVKLIGAGVIVLLAGLVFLMSYFTVDQNQMAVVTRFGHIEYVADPGLHFKMPVVNSTTAYRTDIQSVASGEKWVNTYTVDNQEFDISFTIFYRIAPDKVEFIFANNRDYKERLWSLAIDRLKAAMGQVNVQLVAEKRGELRDAIKKTLIHDTAPLGIEVTDFQLTDLKYTDSFRQAVNNAAVQKANIEFGRIPAAASREGRADRQDRGRRQSQRPTRPGSRCSRRTASAGHRRGQGHPVARRGPGGSNPRTGRRTQGQLQSGRTAPRRALGRKAAGERLRLCADPVHGRPTVTGVFAISPSRTVTTGRE